MAPQVTKSLKSEKRRSDRLMLTVPLRVHGRDPQGKEFVEEARTVTLNRHGACIQLSRPLVPGQTVKLNNLVSRREAPFRVIGPVSPRTDKGGEWGVECVDNKLDIWGIQFPPATKDEADSAALLECRNCHGIAVMHLSLVEVEVLETSGLLAKHCASCKKTTPWGYAEKQVAMGAPPGEAAMLAEAGNAASGKEQRRHRRVSLQLPVLVRDYYGGVEITKSENVSKGGFCFISEKNHLIGEGVLVACPYSASEHSIEVRAKIVRLTEVHGTKQKIYGVRYETQSN
jgi:PilZ domain-containing protein